MSFARLAIALAAVAATWGIAGCGAASQSADALVSCLHGKRIRAIGGPEPAITRPVSHDVGEVTARGVIIAFYATPDRARHVQDQVARLTSHSGPPALRRGRAVVFELHRGRAATGALDCLS